MNNQVCKRITIVVRGEDEHAAEDAFKEAARRIREGNIEGKDTTDNGGFYFEVSEQVEEKDWPA